MAFNVEEFYRVNRRVVIWGSMFLVIWVLRDFFALLFLTFLLVSFTLPPIDWAHRKSRMPRWCCIVLLYAAILAGLSWLIYFTVPQVLREASAITDELHDVQPDILRLRDDLSTRYPWTVPLTESWLTGAKIEETVALVRERSMPWLQRSAWVATFAVTTVLLSLLFSFLIVLDLPRLTEEVRRMRNSRLRDFFAEGGEPVVAFTKVLAAAFRAQASVALWTAVLTGIGYWWLGLPNLALLTIIVFVMSFIPVLGAVIATVPAILVAIHFGGIEKALAVVVMVSIVHIITAYVLTPLVYGRHLRVNPVIVLVVLLFGHHFFGVWGMLLGVPIYQYVVDYVLGVGKAAAPAPAAPPAPAAEKA